MAEQRRNFGSINQYIKRLKDFRRASTIKAGFFYVYNYKFMTHYDYNELKFYDWLPLSFVFKIERGKEIPYFVGLNFHHMPVQSRLIWLSRVKKIAQTYFERGGVRRIPSLMSYDRLVQVMRKSKIGVRNYRFESVQNLREVPLEELGSLLKFYAKTYFGVTIKSIQSRYAGFTP